MGKASSAKKVARAAGLGGSRAYGSRPPWGYYVAVAVLVVLGVVGVYNGREYRNAKVANNGNSPPTVNMSAPWYEGYAVDACGTLLPPIKSSKDPSGIFTSGNGVISINPTTKSAAGHNATLAKFASAVGMTLNAAELEVPGGRLYQDGDTCEGKPGHVYVMTWLSPQAPQQDGILQNKDKVDPTKGYEDTCNPDCDSGVLLENDQLVTIAFLPAPPKHQNPVILQPSQKVISDLTNLVSTAGVTTTTSPVITPSVSLPTSTSSSAGTPSVTSKPTNAKATTTTANSGSSTTTSAVTTTTSAGTTTTAAKK